jgi:hypothetical protein
MVDLGKTTPESIAIESLGFKLAIRVDKYLEKLEAISASLERQAKRALSAARWATVAGGLSATCAVVLAASGLSGDNKDTSYARCQIVVLSATAPPQSLLSACMRASGYRDWCREKEGNFPGTTPAASCPAAASYGFGTPYADGRTYHPAS